jgi:type I restriction enzyme S subunit
MANSQNIPSLRFSEFKEEWEPKKLGELLEFKNGINATKEQYGSGYKFINVLDILNNDFITHDKIIGSVNVTEELVNKFPVKYGDILFQRSSETREEVGTTCVYLDKENTSTFGGFVIRGKKIGDYEPVFLNRLLKTDSARNQITSKSGGSTRYNIGQEILSSIELLYPTVPEQTKIATFLTAVDEKLQALKQKKNLLEQYKKGVMQQIFSQELRFKDDNGNDFEDWKEKILGDICEVKKGKQLNKEELTFTGDYPCINGGINPSGYTDKFNSQENTITISEGGNSCGYINFFKVKFWSGGHNYSIEIVNTEVTDNDFLFQLLKYNETEIMKLRVGSGLPNIQKKDLVAFSLVFTTSKKEQTKIANFLSAIDDKINHCQLQITKTEVWKKGLLQGMFV